MTEDDEKIQEVINKLAGKICDVCLTRPALFMDIFHRTYYCKKCLDKANYAGAYVAAIGI